ncbi:helix-turn-helix domain-containing protein [Companilactobacillus sp. DQM5]|uniref:helix-turn-helix domain-containing protein n=1 Tax=Companilactobacillus sp. DQM5 TaxID=3463359 RepID=UPI00405948E4
MNKEMNKTQLRDSTGVSGNVIAKFNKNKPVALLVSLMKIAETLEVDIGDNINLG